MCYAKLLKLPPEVYYFNQVSFPYSTKCHAKSLNRAFIRNGINRILEAHDSMISSIFLHSEEFHSFYRSPNTVRVSHPRTRSLVFLCNQNKNCKTVILKQNCLKIKSGFLSPDIHLRKIYLQFN